jgi:proteasome lid subunit RPN8/RPN11
MKYIFSSKEMRELCYAGSKAARDDLKEVCGFLIWNGFVIKLIPTENRIKQPCAFGFYSKETYAIERSAKVLQSEIVGTFHSHPLPGAFPGRSEIQTAPDDSLMLIADIEYRELRLWRIKNLNPIPLRFRIISNSGDICRPQLVASWWKIASKKQNRKGEVPKVKRHSSVRKLWLKTISGLAARPKYQRA